MTFNHVVTSPSPTGLVHPDNMTLDLMDCIIFSPYTPTASDAFIVTPPTLVLSTPDVERSFIFGATPGGFVLPMEAHDGDDNSILDEVNHVSEHGFYYKSGTTPTRADVERLADGGALLPDEDDDFEDEGLLADDPVLMETTGNVMFNAFTFGQAPVETNVFVRHFEEDETCEMTPPASPTPDDEEPAGTPEKQLQNEHNYNIPLWYMGGTIQEATVTAVERSTSGETSTVTLELDTAKEPTVVAPPPPKVPPLLLKLSRVEPAQAMAVSTPDVTNQVLDMEAELMDFDLIDFITSPVKAKTPVTESKPVPSPPAAPGPHDQPDPIIYSNPSSVAPSEASPPKRRRPIESDSDSDYDPGSQSDSSSRYSHGQRRRSPTAEPVAKRRRGRPPKTHSVPVHSPAQFRDMDPSDVRYMEMRNRNNEASRRSRLHRKDRDQLVEDEANELRAKYERLVERDRRLEQLCKRWKERLLRLALA